eukprot:COSAG01_NODE_8664_length_2704_cov_3.383877_1_plen_79_part_00
MGGRGGLGTARCLPALLNGGFVDIGCGGQDYFNHFINGNRNWQKSLAQPSTTAAGAAGRLVPGTQRRPRHGATGETKP